MWEYDDVLEDFLADVCTEQVSVQTQTEDYMPINYHNISTSETETDEEKEKSKNADNQMEENIAMLQVVMLDESTQTVRRKILRKKRISVPYSQITSFLMLTLLMSQSVLVEYM